MVGQNSGNLYIKEKIKYRRDGNINKINKITNIKRKRIYIKSS